MFGRKQRDPEPVRRDKVMRLIQLGMAETDAADRDIDSPTFDKAKATFNAAKDRCTKAELAAAYDALRRHGY
ncbi:hypothetical protein [Micromonospora deserti]|uniref:Uncharacterized protein n=1 Tax=Micromonospora deserti TaxID=2070366 RepID=A0A2W2D7X5_9ACTN|nr:hypothetical protein [Micromonospora deserti]PZF88573.1 hypothetical protein C1I99_26285 [Micromonospora deserti]